MAPGAGSLALATASVAGLLGLAGWQGSVGHWAGEQGFWPEYGPRQPLEKPVAAGAAAVEAEVEPTATGWTPPAIDLVSVASEVVALEGESCQQPTEIMEEDSMQTLSPHSGDHVLAESLGAIAQTAGGPPEAAAAEASSGVADGDQEAGSLDVALGMAQFSAVAAWAAPLALLELIGLSFMLKVCRRAKAPSTSENLPVGSQSAGTIEKVGDHTGDVSSDAPKAQGNGWPAFVPEAQAEAQLRTGAEALREPEPDVLETAAAAAAGKLEAEVDADSEPEEGVDADGRPEASADAGAAGPAASADADGEPAGDADGEPADGEPADGEPDDGEPEAQPESGRETQLLLGAGRQPEAVDPELAKGEGPDGAEETILGSPLPSSGSRTDFTDIQAAESEVYSGAATANHGGCSPGAGATPDEPCSPADTRPTAMPPMPSTPPQKSRELTLEQLACTISASPRGGA